MDLKETLVGIATLGCIIGAPAFASFLESRKYETIVVQDGKFVDPKSLDSLSDWKVAILTNRATGLVDLARKPGTCYMTIDKPTSGVYQSGEEHCLFYRRGMTHHPIDANNRPEVFSAINSYVKQK